jgi:hypothetical protein
MNIPQTYINLTYFEDNFNYKFTKIVLKKRMWINKNEWSLTCG